MLSGNSDIQKLQIQYDCERQEASWGCELDTGMLG